MMFSRNPAAIALAGIVLTMAPLARATEPASPPADLSQPLVELRIPRAIGLPALERRVENEWQPYGCILPCTLRLDPASLYRISGDGVVDSDPFAIPPGIGRARVDIKTAPTMLRDIGTLFMVGGLVFIAGGGTTLLWPQDAHASDDAKSSKLVVGVGCLSIGVLTAALGVLLRVLAETTVTVQPQAATQDGAHQ